jgi:hypothetical protein
VETSVLAEAAAHAGCLVLIDARHCCSAHR